MLKKQSLANIAALALGLTCALAHAGARTEGSISIQVVDAEGKPVQNVPFQGEIFDRLFINIGMGFSPLDRFLGYYSDGDIKHLNGKTDSNGIYRLTAEELRAQDNGSKHYVRVSSVANGRHNLQCDTKKRSLPLNRDLQLTCKLAE